MSSDARTGRLERTEYRVPKMDCPSEERTIRMVLEGAAGVHGLAFDLERHRVTVWHEAGEASAVTEKLSPLGFGAELVETLTDPAATGASPASAQDATETRILWLLLAINGVMFMIEVTAGLLVQSAGLLADSLDMFADTAVYGLSLYAVGRAAAHKLRAAHVSGVLQLLLAAGALFEVVRRFVVGSEPDAPWMIGIAAAALVANVTCLMLIFRQREGGAHMKASYIFSTNDVIANVGVIGAGALVALTGSRYPDLIIGALIAVVVFLGAVRILRIRA